MLEEGLRRTEEELFNGEYFIQKIEWKNLRAKNPLEISSMVGAYSPEARALLEQEGPKYQYGTGCLSDGVLGAWLARGRRRRPGAGSAEGKPATSRRSIATTSSAI